MAAIVFVHGIDNQLETSDLILSRLLPALSGSVRGAGNPELADRIWSVRARNDTFDSRAAYYGNLFRAPDQMGFSADLRELTTQQEALMETLSLECLERVAERFPDQPEAKDARAVLDIAEDEAQSNAMGVRNLLREAINTLDRFRWLSRPGMSLATRFVVPALIQVTRYLTEDEIRKSAQDAVLQLVDEDTRVVIGHSLGSVIVYECAHKLTHPLRLLVTIGSPLGLRTIVMERLQPPPMFPPKVTTWLNVANLEDIVAAEHNLRPLFAQKVPDGSRFEGRWFQEPGKNPHRAETYLGRGPVGQEVIKALE